MRVPSPASENDPCWKERLMTYKCFEENNYDKDKCIGFIKNGKYCKKFWQTVCTQRRQNGIYPEMPVGEEREKIRQESMKNYKKPTIHINKEQ